MIPVIFKIGPFPINSFGLMVALAIIAAGLRLEKSFVLNNIDSKYGDKMALLAGLTGIVGARLWYIGEHYSEFSGSILSELFSSAGFTFYGGFLFATAVTILYSRANGINVSAMLDSVGPALCLGYAIGRLGCQLSGDGDYGVATDSILGMSYSTGVAPTPLGVLVYPTPFFESVMSLAVMFVLLKADRIEWWRYPLRRFGLYLSLISIERFLIEFIRIETKFSYGFSEAQFVAIALFVIGGIMILRPKTANVAGAINGV